MDLVRIGFAAASDAGFSRRSNASDLINLYPHFETQGSKSSLVLLNTEGFERVGTEENILIGDILGSYEFQDIVYLATTDRIYRVLGETFEEIATVSFTADRVFIADNGIELMFVGYNGYTYNPDTLVFTDMATVTGWYPAYTVAYMDGYFIFNRAETGQFFISKLYSHEIDPLDWATGEAAPDDTRAVYVAGRQLWIMGERSSEVWYDSGDPLFPFTRISGAVTDIGIANQNTLANVHNSIFFVGNDFRVYMTEGYTPIVISTTAVELLTDELDVSQYLAFTFVNNGHIFYVLHLDEDTTMVYDTTTGLWHRRVSCSGQEDPIIGGGRWRINGAINRYRDSQIVGYAENKFYRLSTDIYTEDRVKIRREVVSLPLNPTVNRITIAEAQIDMEAGGYNPTDLSNCELWMQISKDSGLSWGNRRIAMIGMYGNYKARARWQRLGQFRDAILRFIVTDPIPIRILGLWVRR